MRRLSCWTLAVTVALLLSGCRQSCSVSGQVTFNGQAVKKGIVLLVPVDGKGEVATGMISEGGYEVTNLSPGLYAVQVLSTATAEPVTHLDDLTKEGATGPQASPDFIPAKAVGNNTKVEVQRGRQTLDLALRTPDRGS